MADFRYFVCHSTKDKVFIARLCRLLKRSGLKNFYLAEEPIEFQPNEDLAKIVKNEIDNCCQCIIAVITLRSISSPWVNQEIGYASKAGREIVLIVEEGVDASTLALVAAKQHASFYGADLSTDIKSKVIPYLLRRKKEVEGVK